MKVTILAIALVAALTGMPLSAAEGLPAFMAGDWCAVSGDSRFEERWTGAEGGRMYAVARSFKGERITGFEFLRIEPQPTGYAYLAQPGGRPATAFKLIEQTEQRVVFTNPAHDFPQRIEYFRDASGLHALVSGPPKPGEAPQRFDFRPGRCEPGAAPESAAPGKTMADVLESSTAADWRRPDPARTLYLELASGRVIIELAPSFAPKHVANILALARSGYYDGLPILRVQDNFVVQWGDPEAGDEARRKPLVDGERHLPAEFTRPASADLKFNELPDGDGYAPQTGFADGFPAARDPAAGRAWLTHCYGTLGVGRDDDANSGGGTELYVVIGHAPRQLDRNITVAGRVLAGMELLASLPRGPAPMGFHEQADQHVPIERVRVAADLPEGERSPIEVLRTDTATFTALIESRRNRRDSWYKQPAGYIDVCSVPVPVRPKEQ
jgi:peptidylprolyl isomerase